MRLLLPKREAIPTKSAEGRAGLRPECSPEAITGERVESPDGIEALSRDAELSKRAC